ncbi:MAG: dihydrolipoamide acetyltransferase family protein [Alphaproteobacteria bacterium]|nr:dihydrolipoamide acetyltransferase family protein [Alphaproteobacteria bacterium]
MAVRLRLAALGHTMERGRIVEWYAAEGAPVEQGAPLYSVETDKATVDVEAPAGGVLLRIDAEADREYPVGATLAWIGESGEDLPERTDETAAAPAAVSDEQRVTPVARRLAERHGVDADRLEGTGPGGRVTKEDVQRAVASGTAPPLEEKPSGEPAHDVIALEGIRRVTAERLSAHWTGTPQVTEGLDIDMTAMRAFRNANRSEWRAAYGIVPALNDIVLKAAAAALEANPALNAAFVDGAIHRYREINLGMAVDVEDGLVVPVLRGAGRLDLGGIAHAAADLTARARSRKLAPADFEGATFTVTNLAALGVDWFTPVLNPPQCAILGVGRMRRMPAVAGNEVAIRDIATFVVTFDHRALDGAPAGRFLSRLKRLLESPDPALFAGAGG